MELFGIELILCIKTDLALNKLQRLICHKTQTTNQQDTCKGWKIVPLCSWKNSVNALIGDVGMLLSPCVLKWLKSIEKIQPRMICASDNENLCTTIVSFNSSSNASDETDIITIYDELSLLVWHIPKHNVLIINRDMNVEIGK